MLIEVNQEADEDGNVFTLREDVEIRWNGYSGWLYVAFTIPAGFKSDGASVPRFFWRAVFPPGDNRALRAAFAHDYIYRMHLPGWTKAEADRMFYDLLIEDGIPWYRAKAAYLGVKLFGGAAWSGYHKADSANNTPNRPNRPDRQGAETKADTREPENVMK